MHDADKTKEQLIAELAALRQRTMALEAAVAEHTQVEEALQKSERRYRHLMEYSLGLLCIHDLSGILLEVNAAAARASRRNCCTSRLESFSHRGNLIATKRPNTVSCARQTVPNVPEPI